MKKNDMKKSSIRAIKKENLRLLLNIFLEKKSLSRIELAQESGLSPSTVSALVGELMEAGWLVETGVTVNTGGRKRTELSVRSDKGFLAIVDIAWKRARIHFLDMNLQLICTEMLAESYISGNELLELVSARIEALCSRQSHGSLLGMGLLFQKDMRASDFNVMFSTGWSSDSIGLAEAMRSLYKVPVLEEYSQAYSLREIINSSENAENAHSAYLEIGKKVFISIASGGKLLDLKEGKKADISAFVPHSESGLHSEQLPAGLVQLLAVLTSLFPLETLYLSESSGLEQGVLESWRRALEEMKIGDGRLRVRMAAPLGSAMYRDFGKRVMEHVIYTI